MTRRIWLVMSTFVLFTAGVSSRAAGESGPECPAVDREFAEEVWAKVAERTCIKCHHPGGDAGESELVLHNPLRDRAALAKNRDQLQRLAGQQEDGKSRLLLKATGKLEHGGGEVLKAGSAGLRILEKFVNRSQNPVPEPIKPSEDPSPFFAGVPMMAPERVLRRMTMSLVGRLPTPEERAAVQSRGLKALDPLLNEILKEEAFITRVKEGFNDIFLTLGYDGNGADVLSYDHFETTRWWTNDFDLSHVPEAERQKARWALAATYNQTVFREPLELIAYIIRENRPFTEILTADYLMVSPYSARGYGVFAAIQKQFKNPEDPFEYVPTKIPALKGRDGKVQESPTGLYPHAGLLSMFQYLRRYPTTETNRNRLRARMYYQHFLGIDIMALAPRVTDAAAVSAKYETPTMQAADCVVCHKTIDPVAGLFQDYYNDMGHHGPRKDGWFKDMFSPGLEGEKLPAEERWRSLQWLGERTAKDPRFAKAMVEHVYYILMGRKVLQAPEDIEDPLFLPKRRAYQEQRKVVEQIAEKLVQSRFNLKVAFKWWIASEFYRVDGLTRADGGAPRRAELDDLGLAHLITPEQMERKLAALFGKKWGRLEKGDGGLDILYGGIDSKEITERMTDPSGAMGAIQRIMANDIACTHVALDFSREPSQRKLFPEMELNILPGQDAESDAKIRRTLVHLHHYLLGRHDPADHPEIERTYRLWTGVIEEAKEQKALDQFENWFCKGSDNGERPKDATYTLRAWRAVVTYLLRQHEFLYE